MTVITEPPAREKLLDGNQRQAWLLKTLEFVNGIRAEHGGAPLTEMPCGEPRYGVSCPIANALRDLADVDATLGVGAGLHTVRLMVAKQLATYQYPCEVEAFIAAFDRGGYPDLIGRS